MENKTFKKFYLFACIGLLILSFYPLWMGVRVVTDMIVDGTVMKENYPKYIIPYTPISLALLLGVVAMPLFMKLNQLLIFFSPRVRTTVIRIGKSAYTGLVTIIQGRSTRPEHLKYYGFRKHGFINAGFCSFCTQHLHSACLLVRSGQKAGMVMVR